MSEVVKTPPLVFISCSHDSDEHKTWVREFAAALRKVGIDVILDQWEIGPGDDVPKFMEQSVRKALRVIMICTEQYVRKADDGKGGAGYEAMVVTGELVGDLGTRKFIPIVRQAAAKPSLPACVSGRYFVNFSIDEGFNEKLEELARNIQQSPRFEKPPLGDNPFTTSVPAVPSGGLIQDGGPASVEPYEVYKLGLSFAEGGNFAKWRELIHGEKFRAGDTMLRWKAENQPHFPIETADLPAFFLPAIGTHCALFAAAFGAFDSTDERFHNQLSLLDWFRNPKGWEQSGPTEWTQLPALVLFTYQALLGGLALSRHRPEVAYSLATTSLSNNYSGRDAKPLFKNSELTGWPDSLAHACTSAWVFLRKAAKEWEWLWKLFGSEEDVVASIVAYYLFLNTIDFISATKTDKAISGKLRGLETPLFLSHGESDIDSRTRNLLSVSISFIGRLFAENEITEESLPALWDNWLIECSKWLGAVYSDSWRSRASEIPHRDLPRMLFRGPQKYVIE